MHSAILIKPVFGITPEPLNAVNMISAFRPPIFFFNDNMIAAKAQRSIGVPIIGIVKAARFGIFLNKRNKCFCFAGGHWNDSDISIAFHHSKNQNFSASAPTAFTLSMAAKYGLIAFNYAFQNRLTLFSKTQCGSNRSEELLYSFAVAQFFETQAVGGHSQNKVI